MFTMLLLLKEDAKLFILSVEEINELCMFVAASITDTLLAFCLFSLVNFCHLQSFWCLLIRIVVFSAQYFLQFFCNIINLT